MFVKEREGLKQELKGTKYIEEKGENGMRRERKADRREEEKRGRERKEHEAKEREGKGKRWER